jgi:NAD(P)-dependent dehydrogenase (short-subunit alcohol dehydrogenase family)
MTPELPLQGQAALITGAGSGLGQAVARVLAAAGAACVLAGRRAEPLQALQAELEAGGWIARAASADISDPDQVHRLIAMAAEPHGRLDVLVNSAGVFQMAPFEETPLAVFDEMLAVNLRGAFLCCQAAWPVMRRAGGGQIVNISSVAGVEGFAGSSAYCASKFGLNGLSAALALEGRAHNIRVFAVCPGNVNTPIWHGQAPEAVRARMMPPEPVAEFIGWLVSAPRNLRFDPVIIRNFGDPWAD